VAIRSPCPGSQTFNLFDHAISHAFTRHQKKIVESQLTIHGVADVSVEYTLVKNIYRGEGEPIKLAFEHESLALMSPVRTLAEKFVISIALIPQISTIR
jgi:predicted nucleic acid-binding protein